MPPKRWGGELNLKFVKAYKENECLWNRFDPLYKDRNARETALKRISNEMQLDDFGTVEVKAKIKSLRGTYNLEVGKLEKSERSGCSLAEVYVPTVKWFSVMKEVMSKGTLKRQTQSNLTLVSQTTNTKDSKLNFCDQPTGDNASSSQSAEDMQADFREDYQQQPTKRKCKPHSKIQQRPITVCQPQQLTESLNRNFSEANEWDIFGNLVSAHLKKLTPRRALEAEKRIHAVLNDCRMQDLLLQTPVHSSNPGSSVNSTESSILSGSSGNSGRAVN